MIGFKPDFKNMTLSSPTRNISIHFGKKNSLDSRRVVCLIPKFTEEENKQLSQRISSTNSFTLYMTSLGEKDEKEKLINAFNNDIRYLPRKSIINFLTLIKSNDKFLLTILKVITDTVLYITYQQYRRSIPYEKKILELTF